MQLVGHAVFILESIQSRINHSSRLLLVSPFIQASLSFLSLLPHIAGGRFPSGLSALKAIQPVRIPNAQMRLPFGNGSPMVGINGGSVDPRHTYKPSNCAAVHCKPPATQPSNMTDTYARLPPSSASRARSSGQDLFASEEAKLRYQVYRCEPNWRGFKAIVDQVWPCI